MADYDELYINGVYVGLLGGGGGGGSVSWGDIQNKPTAFPPSQHTHDAGDIEGEVLSLTYGNQVLEFSAHDNMRGYTSITSTGGLNVYADDFTVNGQTFATEDMLDGYLQLGGGTLTGNLALTNTHGIRIQDSNGSAKEIAAVNASNQFSFGYGAYVNNYQTIIRGGSIMKMAVAKTATGGGEANSVTLNQNGTVSFGDATKWRDGLALTTWTSFTVTADTTNTINIRSQTCEYNAALGLVRINVQVGITATAAIAAGARTPVFTIPTAYRPKQIEAVAASHVQTGTINDMVNAWAHSGGPVYVRRSTALNANATSDYIQITGMWHI